MTSHLYSKPTRSRTQKLVLALLAVIVVLIAALLFVWLKPASNTTPGAAVPGNAVDAPASSTTVVGSAPVSSSNGATPATGPAQWGTPLPGDGGPSTKSGAGVPRGYDASDAGATKAAVNAVVAARWMKFRIENPDNSLGELVVADAQQRTAVITQFTPVDPLINAATGKHDVLPSPAGGKVLGGHLVRRDETTAVVKVLWEQFSLPEKGQSSVSLEPIEVQLTRVENDWLVSGLDRTTVDDSKPSSAIVGVVGPVPEWVPVPSEGWYW